MKHFCYSKKNCARYYHKCTEVFVYSTLYSCQILMKIELSVTDFRKILRYQICAVEAELFYAVWRTDEQMEKQTDRHEITWCFSDRASWIDYTGCPRRNGQNFGRVFLMLNYTAITLNTYIQSWTVTEIMAIEKCGLLECPRTVRRPWRHNHPLRMPGNETPLANIAMQWPWRDNEQLRPA